MQSVNHKIAKAKTPCDFNLEVKVSEYPDSLITFHRNEV